MVGVNSALGQFQPGCGAARLPIMSLRIGVDLGGTVPVPIPLQLHELLHLRHVEVWLCGGLLDDGEQRGAIVVDCR